MAWCIVKGRRVLASYGREASARLNLEARPAPGLKVLEIPDSDPRLRPVQVPTTPADYAGRRRQAFGRIDVDLQLEAITEALFALCPLGLAPKLDALRDQVAAIKAAHPKPPTA